MKTDTIFYQLFKEFPQIFFELIGKPDTNPNAYKLTVPEIKQRSFRLDGVFSPLEELPNEPLYFLETQFYKDEQFYDRLFNGIFLYFNQYQPINDDWDAIVIYDKTKEELTDTATQEKGFEFIETIFVYKFPNLSREEIEAMLDLSLLRETRVFREAKEEGELEGKLKIVSKLLQKGLSIQEVAEIAEIDIETIREKLKNS